MDHFDPLASYTDSVSSVHNPLYQPLDRERKQVRILALHSTNDYEDVQATLSLALLSTRSVSQGYEAISYCWGHSTQRKRITLNGLAVLAPASAVDILRQLRPYAGTRRLWIDFLCINQYDIDERGYQVTLMYDIYKNSQSTIIWLGEHDGRTKDAIRLCEQIASRVSGDFRDDGPASETQNASFARLGYSASDLACLQPIFTSRWFTRVWVFQEVVASSTRVCHVGKFAIPWKTLDVVHAFLYWLTSRKSRTRDILDGTYDSILLWFRKQRNIDLPLKIRQFKGLGWIGNQPLNNAMISIRDLDATDPRDKVYGILSLISESEVVASSPGKLYPDYRRSVRSLFPDVVRRLILEPPSLHPIVDIGRWPILQLGHDAEDWPSWVPRIDKPTADEAESTRPFWIGFAASQNLAASVKPLGPNDNLDILTVGGFLKDIVSSTVSFHGSEALTMRNIGDIFYSVLRSANDQAARRALPVILYGTFIAGRLDGASLKDSGFEAYNQFLDLIKHPPATILEARARLTNNVEVKVMAEILDTCHNRCFFFMRSGHFGLGPHNMQKDNFIAILLGFPWLVALRPSNGRLRLVGPCFVYGWMDGEATVKLRNAGTQPDIFEIY